MPEYATLDALMHADTIGQEDLTLPNGLVVTVKGMSAFERKLLYKGAVDNQGNLDAALIETRIIKYGMVNPKLSMDQAEEWMKKTLPSVIDAVTGKVRDLSGMGEGAEKSEV